VSLDEKEETKKRKEEARQKQEEETKKQEETKKREEEARQRKEQEDARKEEVKEEVKVEVKEEVTEDGKNGLESIGGVVDLTASSPASQSGADPEEMKRKKDQEKEKAQLKKQTRERTAAEADWMDWDASAASAYFLTFRQCKQSTVFEVNNLTGQALTRCSAAKLEGLGMLAGDALVVENVMKSKIFVFVLQVAALFLFLSRSLSPCNLALKRKFPDDEDTVTLPEVTGKKFCYCLFFLRRVHVISLSIWLQYRQDAPRPRSTPRSREGPEAELEGKD